ncbi:hypothetical protein WJX72_009492 [[Myrmecia] bisecta]|uniref:Enkurin domain-containing protein n=1 Tax=[Myrmecia] bisecta TaxID=41462 RepID=A0AAW1Q0T6_9CHLO
MAHRQPRQQQESIYNLVEHNTGAASPVVARQHAARPLKPLTSPKVSMHQNSSQLQDCLNPVRGVRDQQRRAGITPVNHARHNATAVKEQSALNRLRKLQLEEEAAAEAAAVARKLPAPTTSSGYGRATPRRPSSAQSSDRDHVKENIQDAVANRGNRLSARSPQAEGAAWLKKEAYGKVPQYLQDIKLELVQQQAAEQAAKEASIIPAGMRILPEEERLEMLAVLRQSRAEVDAKIQALPFVIETPSQKKYQAGLEARLAEIEQATKLFSRSKVLVQA